MCRNVKNHKRYISIPDKIYIFKTKFFLYIIVHNNIYQGKLEKLLDGGGFLAVYWYARNCKRSENILKGTSVHFKHNPHCRGQKLPTCLSRFNSHCLVWQCWLTVALQLWKLALQMPRKLCCVYCYKNVESVFIYCTNSNCFFLSVYIFEKPVDIFLLLFWAQNLNNIKNVQLRM